MATALGRAAALGSVLVAGLAGPAWAGAWTQPEGRGQVIVSASTGVSPQNALSGSLAAPQSSFVSLFGEYGLREGLTLGATAFVEIPDDGGADHTANVGVALRKRLWQRDAGDVASVQIGYVHPLDALAGAQFGGEFADTRQEVSLRGLYGRGFWGDWGTAFVSLEGGYHKRFDAEEDELRLDVTAGVALDPRWLWLLSLYTTFPVGDGEDNAVKIAPSLAYTFEARPVRGPPEATEPAPWYALRPVTLQLSLTQDLLDLGNGVGVQISVWKSF